MTFKQDKKKSGPLNHTMRPRAQEARIQYTRDDCAPGHGVIVAVIEGLNALLALAPAELLVVRGLEEARGQLDEPLGIDGAHLTHVLLAGQHQLVVDDPVRLPLEQRARRVDEHRCLLHHRLVPLLINHTYRC